VRNYLMLVFSRGRNIRNGHPATHWAYTVAVTCASKGFRKSGCVYASLIPVSAACQQMTELMPSYTLWT
jgi:hypothetical protein